MEEYSIKQTAGNNSVQITINGNVLIDGGAFMHSSKQDDFVLEYFYVGDNREFRFNDGTIEAFNSWYALPPESDFKVRVKEIETGKIDVLMTNAVKHLLIFMKQENNVAGIVRNYLRSYEIQSDMYAHNYNFVSDAQRDRFVQFVFCCVTIANMLKPCNTTLNFNYIPLCGYIYRHGVYDFHFPIDIDKDVLRRRCNDSEVLDYDKLVKVDCPDYYILDLGAHILCRTILPSYFLWLGGIDEKIIEKNPEILDLCNYKLAAR